MDTTFPFGFPTATAFYLVWFVATLVLHVLFMNYVLAGSFWLAWSLVAGKLRPGKDGFEAVQQQPASSVSVLYDWIPSMLSGAITAGVAPLLFLQILYQREFYTANLLLFNRWMSILPVLIVGFYSLYLLRTKWLARRSAWIRALTSVLPFLCILFVAYSWTENHVLSVQATKTWHAFYATGKQVYFTPQIVPRLALWVSGSFSTMAVWLAWQLKYRTDRGLAIAEPAFKELGRIGLTSLTIAALAIVAFAWAEPTVLRAFLGPMARWYSLAAGLGVAAQGWMWLRAASSNGLSKRDLSIGTVGLLMAVTGVSVCREALRLLTLGEERLVELIPQHARAFEFEGFWIFLFFTIVNAGLIAWCFRLVKHGYSY